MRTNLLLLSLLAALPLHAQSGEPVPVQRRAATAAPLTGPLRLDGRLDDAAWAAALPATGFTQAYPDPGAPASEPTEVRVLVGPDAVYVGARMFDSHPDSIAAQLSRRDVYGTYSDRILLFIDSHDDRRTAFHFAVNPRGVKQDSYQYDDTREDQSWDAVWDVATAVDSLGWTAEFRIPLSQLRFLSRSDGERVWGVGFMRELARRDERSTWSPWTRNSPGFVSSFGELRGLGTVRAPARLELLPYTSARLDRVPGSARDPFHSRNDVAGSMGADFQYGLPGGLTLTGTVNPDFGQVEVDPAVVNLTAFEVFFPERRPFFVEGSDVFRFGTLVTRNSFSYPQYFYSRRIGRQPQRPVSDAEIAFVDAPDQTTILGAAKVSGKINGWSVGLLDAVTAEEQSRYRTTAGVDASVPVEPLSNYLVGRLRRDLRQGRTVIGGIFTAANRDMSDSVFRPLLRSSAYIAGVDGQHAWDGRAWTVSGFLAGSRVAGSESAIASAQRSSARYFQRPDDRSVELDAKRTSLGGRIGGVALSHSGNWDGSVTYQEVSPGFEANDLGFQSFAGRRGVSTHLGRRVNRPAGAFLSYAYNAYQSHAWNWDGDNVSADVGAAASGTFRNFWSVSLSGGATPAAIDDRLTRGGPKAGVPGFWRGSATVTSDRRKPLLASASASTSEYRDGQFVRTVSAALTLRPSTSVQVSMGPRYSRVMNTSQYVLARTDTLARATFGRRYVFADVDQHVLSVEARVNWTFTPDLTLEVYAQPYVSVGDFENYKEFLRPGRYEFGVYGRDQGTITPAQNGGFTVDPDGAGPAAPFTVGGSAGQRDFTQRSLRGNAVLRWEYRRGSTLFFVWQQRRTAEYLHGRLDFGDVSGAFTEPAQNVFMIKATYWVSR